MGNGESIELPNQGQDLGYVAIVLRYSSKVRILYPTTEVENGIYEVVKYFYDYDDCDLSFDSKKEKYGILQYKLPGNPFMVNGDKESATIGKNFVIRLFTKMYCLGYDFVTASDLTRTIDMSTLYFKKVTAERPSVPIFCLAPGGYDKLILLKHNASHIEVVKEAIATAWRPGIQRQKTVQSCGEDLEEIKVNGNPWFSSGEESTGARNLLSVIIQKMQNLGWKLHGAVNIKGGTDSLFFIQSIPQPTSSGIISFNRQDRLRLIGFNDSSTVKDSVHQCIMTNYQCEEPSIQDYYGAHEFKLQGYPFHCSGTSAIKTRRLVSKLLQKMQSIGWTPITGIDVSRKDHDKSVIAFVKTNPAVMPYACIALSDVDTVRLIDFPTYERERLAEIIRATYGYGISKELPRDGECCLEFELQGCPWENGNTWGIHGRAVLLHLLKKANELGWQLVCSLDVSAKYIHRDNGPDYPLDVHSWFLCKPPSSSSVDQPSAPPMFSTEYQPNYNLPPPNYSEVMNS